MSSGVLTGPAGNLGLLADEHTVILLPFAEPATLAPSDQVGTLADLTDVDSTNVVTEGAWAQPTARLFTDGGYYAVDQAGASSLLTRDVSVQAIATLEDDGNTRWTLIARGKGGSAAEYCAYGLELVAESATLYRLRWYWQTTAGVEVTETGATMLRFGAGEPVLLTATRRWEAPDRVVCRYYLGAELLGESVSADGSIGGGTTGTTTIGCRYVGGSYTRRWSGTIDELKVVDYALAPEEVEATWRRLSVHQPQAVDLVRDLLPPGMPIAGDPSSRVQRLLRWLGQGLGLAASHTEQLGDLLPDRAYGEALERWERVTKIRRQAFDTLETRRARVAAHLARRGATKANLLEVLAELLDCDAGDLEVISLSNTLTDTFSELNLERWTPTVPASWSVIGGTLRAQAAVTADLQWTPSVRRAPTIALPLHTSAEAFLAAKVTFTALPADAEAGLYLAHGVSGAHLFFGYRNVAGGQLVYQRYRDGAALDGAPVVLAAGAPAGGAYWLRIRVQGGGELTLEWSTDGVTFADLANLSWIAGWRWLGFYVRNYAVLPGALDVRFGDFLARQPLGTRPFCAYVYRDPAIAGEPDLIGARALMRRFRYAFWHAAPTVSRSLLCDDQDSVCDAGPLGGF